MNGINILLVEDTEAHIELIVRGLRKWSPGPRIHVVKDGQEVLDYLFSGGRNQDKEGPFLPDLIILDLKLRKMDGIEVLRRVKADQRLRKIPVVIFSSSGDEEGIEASYRNGANGYIVKPIDPKEFEQKLRDIESYVAESNAVPDGD